MFLVVGLGNVGKKYECNRHNVGFMILDKFCEKFNIDLNKENSTGIYGIGNVNGKKIICLKPKTFMNLSGNALNDVMNYYKISNDNVLVIYDDVDLDFLKLRIRIKGSHGGHNGIKDIISKINTNLFKRIKVGIGENKNIDLANYVLSDFTKEEKDLLNENYENILKCVEMVIQGKIVEAMNLFNWVMGGVLWG